MKITKIIIENYKSIKKIEFDLQRYGSSYTTMLVGINESGKSNILEAMSYLDTPQGVFDYDVIHNQKDEDNNPVDFWFHLEFEEKKTYLSRIKEKVENSELLDFEIQEVLKNVYLEDGEKQFSDSFTFKIKKLSKGLFIKKTQKSSTDSNGESTTIDVISLSKENDEEQSFQELTEELFIEWFSEEIKEIARKYEPRISFWSPSERYLVSQVNLNEFKSDIHSNIPLKHIFYIAGFEDAEKIKLEIERIRNDSLRRKLASTLSTSATKYVKNIWKHNITIDIEIAESGICNVSIRDDGENNKHNFHKMSVRSEGFKQFMSLILSLSIETKLSKRKNNLILIDEPEAHLHPSGIRDLRKELLAIGKNNYLFVSTHSPYLVDREDKERNVIIRKNKYAETEAVRIDKHTNIIDDEVLREAFGIEVYKDLLNPHSILVEGASDKKLLLKALKINNITHYGITNGHGSNIDTLAAKLNDTDISMLVILDDDQEGKSYKDKIIRMGGSYSNMNVYTIRDLCGSLVEGATIEDTLPTSFLTSVIKKMFDEEFTGENLTLILNETSPFISQLRVYLTKKGKNKKVIESFTESIKIKIADTFNPTKSVFKRDFTLLSALCDSIISCLN